jgi:hypothetical protein
MTVPLDGKRRGLHIWLCPGDPGRVVVLGHGLGLSKSASLAQARLLNDAGYTVAMFDLRNHGRSSADRACWGMGTAHLAGQPERTGWRVRRRRLAGAVPGTSAPAARPRPGTLGPPIGRGRAGGSRVHGAGPVVLPHRVPRQMTAGGCLTFRNVPHRVNRHDGRLCTGRRPPFPAADPPAHGAWSPGPRCRRVRR